MKYFALRWLNALAFAVTIAVNWAADSIPLGGRTTGEISAMYPVLVTPADYAFSIWLLIYALLAGFVVLQLLPIRRGIPEIAAIGPWFIISCALNCAWLLLWHYLYIPSSVFMMIGLLLSLVIIYMRIRPAVGKTSTGLLASLLVRLPFSVYLGWVSVATIVNVSIGLSSADWSGWGLPDVVWAAVVLVAAGLLALYMAMKRRDAAYALAVAWGLIAIGAELGGASVITWIAWKTAGLLIIIALDLLRKRKRH